MVLVPNGNFLVGPVMLQGPCKGPIELRINGILLAPTGNSAAGDSWLNIHWVNNLVIDGGGSLNGQGPTAWPCHFKGGGCGTLPIVSPFSFVSTNNIIIFIYMIQIYFGVFYHGYSEHVTLKLLCLEVS